MASVEWWIWPLLLYTAGILAAIDALWQGRTAQGTAAWVLALILMPALALPFYAFFGSRRFGSYRRSRRRKDSKLGAIERHIRSELREHVVNPDEITFPLNRLYRLPMVSGNETELLINGKVTFNAILNAAQTARHTLCVQFYTFRDDALGQHFADILCGKAAEGVRVYLLYDEIGSGGLDEGFLQQMTDAGIEVSRFNPIRLRNRTNLNFRNHRKLVIIDNHTAFVGGHNVGIEYLGLDPEFGHWRDTHMSIVGPATLTFQLSFAEDWYWATGKEPELIWDAPKAAGAKEIMCINAGPADYYESASLYFTHLINSAKKRCWLVSPYFVPDQTVYSALQLAGLRGVDVRIVLPGVSDNWMVAQANRSYVASLSKAQVQFYTYKPGFLHQKVMLIDDEWSSVGSANLDNRSLRINFEIAALVKDKNFAAEIEQMMLDDLSQCESTHVDDRWWKQLLARLLRLIAPVL
ncbi:MAG: cardiolipin synthase [Thalassolituus sp.]